jgi:hypothetical protein
VVGSSFLIDSIYYQEQGLPSMKFVRNQQMMSTPVQGRIFLSEPSYSIFVEVLWSRPSCCLIALISFKCHTQKGVLYLMKMRSIRILNCQDKFTVAEGRLRSLASKTENEERWSQKPNGYQSNGHYGTDSQGVLWINLITFKLCYQDTLSVLEGSFISYLIRWMLASQ